MAMKLAMVKVTFYSRRPELQPLCIPPHSSSSLTHTPDWTLPSGKQNCPLPIKNVTTVSEVVGKYAGICTYCHAFPLYPILLPNKSRYRSHLVHQCASHPLPRPPHRLQMSFCHIRAASGRELPLCICLQMETSRCPDERQHQDTVCGVCCPAAQAPESMLI